MSTLAAEARLLPQRGYGRWRATTLISVHLLFVAHVIHWWLRGTTLAPLELNEVMYTLEAGIVTAGFLFMVAAALGTVIFGRFFCSWACHLLALQDLCAWILRKLGIHKPRVIRSRALLLVPPFTAFYMIIWPQIKRLVEGREMPRLHLRSDAEGWASFVTNDFWRNLPGPWIAGLTFAVCGFAMVYILGSRSFCTYGCPYGAIFAVCDRLAPGRIRVTDDCVQCATCTATCTSGIRVHEEVDRHGGVVNPACLKDLDCVSACPEKALYFGWGEPGLLKSRQSGGRFGLAYDFSFAEDIFMGVVFLAVLATFRGLYGAVPLLLTLGLGGIIAFISVHGLRLVFAQSVRIRSVALKREGHVTRAGWAFALLVAAVLSFTGHSAYIRYNELRGLDWEKFTESDSPEIQIREAAKAYSHLAIAESAGFFPNARVERALLATAVYLDRNTDTERWARRVLERSPNDVEVRLHLADSLFARWKWSEAKEHFDSIILMSEVQPFQLASAHHGRALVLATRRDWAAARRDLEAAVEFDPDRAETHAELGGILAEQRLFPAALAAFTEAVRLDPELAGAHYNLGTLQAHLGLLDEAAHSFLRALDADPGDATTLNNLGFVQQRLGHVEQALETFKLAIESDPINADAHFNLARLLVGLDEMAKAQEHLRTAARLDPRYRSFLD